MPDAKRYSAQEVSDAINAAVTFVQDQTDDERIIDCSNLVVNLALGLLEDPDASKKKIIREAYGESPKTVLSWIA